MFVGTTKAYPLGAFLEAAVIFGRFCVFVGSNNGAWG